MKTFLYYILIFILIINLPILFGGCGTTVNITINYNNDITANTVVTIEKGSTINLPDPNSIISPHEYLIFDCWCTDYKLSEEFDATQPITKSFTIYAKWKLNGFTWLRISTPSMQASGFNTGDYILLENVTNVNELAVGDLVSFYSYYPTDFIPTKQDAKLNNSKILFRQITNVIYDNGNIFYETKGTSNNNKDAYPVCSNLVIGKYIQKIDNPTQYQKYIGYYPEHKEPSINGNITFN